MSVLPLRETAAGPNTSQFINTPDPEVPVGVCLNPPYFFSSLGIQKDHECMTALVSGSNRFTSPIRARSICFCKFKCRQVSKMPRLLFREPRQSNRATPPSSLLTPTGLQSFHPLSLMLFEWRWEPKFRHTGRGSQNADAQASSSELAIP